MHSQTGRRIQSVSGAFTSYRWMSVVCLSILLDPIRARWWNEDSLALHSIRNDNQVQIMQLYEGRNTLRLRCDAQGINASDSLVLLACPSVKTGFCRQNCISPCLIVEGSPECSNRTLTPIQYCHYRVVSADHVRVDYKVQLESDQDSGKWW
ncbi:hypothetical protein FGIG_07801 [Fasciola gigantica]|uniref:Uncharacterized protein n=1 Tax=Fasciola gigantica TaxID=46835 RepID=A0A504Z058_FASGI|nr:hypothetical protein FGIG_07801 [Fasciola gigantica]